MCFILTTLSAAYCSCSIVQSHHVLLVCKGCKVGHYPWDKPGQRSCMKKEAGLIHLLAYTCAYSFKLRLTCNMHGNSPTRLVNCAFMSLRLLLVLYSVWWRFSFTHTLKQNTLNLSILISVGSNALITKQRRVWMDKKKRSDEMKKGGGILFWCEKLFYLICPWSGTLSPH